MSKYDSHDASGAPSIEELWLSYFNNYLFEHGTISENEYKRMTEKIAEKTARYSPLKEAR